MAAGAGTGATPQHLGFGTTESDIALLFGPATLLLIAPIALTQGTGRLKRARTEGVGKMMTTGDTQLPSNSGRLLALGVLAAAAWIVVILLVRR